MAPEQEKLSKASPFPELKVEPRRCRHFLPMPAHQEVPTTLGFNMHRKVRF